MPLCLRRTPPDALLEKSHASWVMTIRSSREALNVDIDHRRFQVALKRLLPKLREWPSPYDLLAELPPRPHIPERALPDVPPEKMDADLVKVRELMASIFDGGKSLTNTVHNEKARAQANARAKV